MSNEAEKNPLLDIIETKGNLNQSPPKTEKPNILTVDQNQSPNVVEKRQKQPSPFLRKERNGQGVNRSQDTRNRGMNKNHLQNSNITDNDAAMSSGSIQYNSQPTNPENDQQFDIDPEQSVRSPQDPTATNKSVINIDENDSRFFHNVSVNLS